MFPSRDLRTYVSRLLEIFDRRLDEIINREELLQVFRPLEDIHLPLRSILNKNSLSIFGVDGSMSVEERLEMILLYVCAVAYRGSLEINDGVKVKVFGAEKMEPLSVALSVPIWLEDLPNLEPSHSVSTDYEITRSMEGIAGRLMRLAELLVAYNALVQRDTAMVVLDGLLSGMVGPLSRDVRLLLHRYTPSAYEEIETKYGRVTKEDLLVASVLGPGSFYIPARGLFLHSYLGVASNLET